MWRFLLPAVAMTAGVIVLFAGVLGDLKSLPDISDHAIAIISGAESRHSPLPPAPPPAVFAAAAAEQQVARDALQHQITDLQRQAGDLQNQIEQRSHDLEQRSHEVDAGRAEMDGLREGLAAMRTETEELRQGIDTLRQQRKAEEDALARGKAQERRMATATAPRRPPAPRAAPSLPPLASAPAGTSAAQQLRNAQQSLAAGRPDEARYILAMVQTQMVLRPVTPGQPLAEVGNPSATDVGAAIRWLDMGANSQAMQAISRAIDRADSAAPPGPWLPPSGNYWSDSTR